MSNALRFLTAIATCLTGVLAPHNTADAGDRRSTSIELINMSTDEEAAARRDVALFAEAGLPLPQITVRHHQDTVACHGHEGLHRKVGSRSVIDICTKDSGVWEARVLLHELTHAWAFHFLTPQHKAAFKKLPRLAVLARLQPRDVGKRTGPSRQRKSWCGRSVTTPCQS